MAALASNCDCSHAKCNSSVWKEERKSSSSRAANDLDNDDEVDHDDEMSLCKCLCTMGQ